MNDEKMQRVAFLDSASASFAFVNGSVINSGYITSVNLLSLNSLSSSYAFYIVTCDFVSFVDE